MPLEKNEQLCNGHSWRIPNLAGLTPQSGLHLPHLPFPPYTRSMERASQVINAAAKLRAHHGALFADIKTNKYRMQLLEEIRVLDLIQTRAETTNRLTAQAVEGAPEAAQEATVLLGRWMDRRSVVRVIGAGRGLLAASMAAHRLSAGGARVHAIGDILPMPHSLRGGGIVAVITEGQAEAIARLLIKVRKKNRDIKILGIGYDSSNQFTEVCDIFIPIPIDRQGPRSDETVIDVQEYVVAEILDALVLFAGRELGYTDNRWKLGYGDFDMAMFGELES